jgi:hypothetical protein
MSCDDGMSWDIMLIEKSQKSRQVPACTNTNTPRSAFAGKPRKETPPFSGPSPCPARARLSPTVSSLARHNAPHLRPRCVLSASLTRHTTRLGSPCRSAWCVLSATLTRRVDCSTWNTLRPVLFYCGAALRLDAPRRAFCRWITCGKPVENRSKMVDNLAPSSRASRLSSFLSTPLSPENLWLSTLYSQVIHKQIEGG